jgi:hypothetical protein
MTTINDHSCGSIEADATGGSLWEVVDDVLEHLDEIGTWHDVPWFGPLDGGKYLLMFGYIDVYVFTVLLLA